MNDSISREAAIDVIKRLMGDSELSRTVQTGLHILPSAQPEPAIPISWINKNIEWLKSLDNSFSALTAVQISAMVKTWEDEQDE